MTRQDELTIQALRNAMAAETRGHQLSPSIASTVLDRAEARQEELRRLPRHYLAIAAACVIVAGSAVATYAVRESRGPTHKTPPGGSACNAAVITGALPAWARAGFSPGTDVNAYITGASGDIIGVLFVDPLRSPPAPGTNNKILWVAKDPGTGPLLIHARLEGSKQEVTRSVKGGPGPSIVNMPAPGCWRLTLTWSGHTDTAAVPYAP